jgi:NADP-dependent 3-hydroxy acid dehydrogenase YdfG
MSGLRQCILITGATGAIGGALAEAYAEPGVTLVLQGRNQPRLDELAVLCRARGASVLTRSFDIADLAMLNEFLATLELSHAPDLVIVNQSIPTSALTGRVSRGWRSTICST